MSSADFSPRVVLPGEVVPDIPEEGEAGTEGATRRKVLLGPGLRREGSSDVVVSKAGVLRRKTVAGEGGGGGEVFWVDVHSRRYVAARGENVIGVVTNKAGDFFRVDIGVSETASLSYLAFEGATKKNRLGKKLLLYHVECQVFELTKLKTK